MKQYQTIDRCRDCASCALSKTNPRFGTCKNYSSPMYGRITAAVKPACVHIKYRFISQD
ncbi:MAG: hypothetical protein MJZ30_11665 [Paludibacteraceae bacterium]|nr:hypothetical protein [Paludibacteraceae bacterium]